MKIKKIDHVNFSVNSYEESVEYYQRVFGFEVVEQGVRYGLPWGILKSGEACIAIYERPDAEHLDVDEAKRRGLHSVNHFGLQVEDRKEFEKVIEQQKLRIDQEYEYPNSYSWYVIDPSGYEIEVSCWNDNKVVFPPLNAAM